ncbi:MAG: GNAT family N-acetyltransferase [Nocardioidaceae bacterium]|nr:GNAT family N-acetyltransferase [Nocardioidaceae bacterium]
MRRLASNDADEYSTLIDRNRSHVSRFGLATCAGRAPLALARDELGAADILAGVTLGNQPSIRVLRRLSPAPTKEFPSITRYHLAMNSV